MRILYIIYCLYPHDEYTSTIYYIATGKLVNSVINIFRSDSRYRVIRCRYPQILAAVRTCAKQVLYPILYSSYSAKIRPWVRFHVTAMIVRRIAYTILSWSTKIVWRNTALAIGNSGTRVRARPLHRMSPSRLPPTFFCVTYVFFFLLFILYIIFFSTHFNLTSQTEMSVFSFDKECTHTHTHTRLFYKFYKEKRFKSCCLWNAQKSSFEKF